MGNYLFQLPDVGEGVTEAEIVHWYVKPGDSVAEDANLVDVMTDKATVEMTAVHPGIIIAIHGELGDRVPVGSVLVEIEVEGKEFDNQNTIEQLPTSLEAEAKSNFSLPKQDEKQKPEPETSSTNVPILGSSVAAKKMHIPSGLKNSAPLAAPATRQRAFELGIPLQFVPGTGPGGRIMPDDLEDYIEQGGEPATHIAVNSPRSGHTETKIIGLRRKIAERMQDAKSRIPHIAYVEETDITELEALRAIMNADKTPNQPKLTLLPFLMRALALLQPQFPHIFSHFDDQNNILHSYDGVHVGIATQTGGGLMVPVVRHVETLDIWGCAENLLEVTTAAKQGRAKREELTGSTITITSLGALGGIMSTPVINSPEVAIIGPNKIVERPVVKNGQIIIRKMMNISSSFDHRIVDGYDAARIIQKLKQLIENPSLLFMKQI